MDHNLVVEYVPCCVCRQTGAVRRWVLFKKTCPVCEGSGQRKIIMDARFTADERAMVRESAILGMNMRPPSFSRTLFGAELF